MKRLYLERAKRIEKLAKGEQENLFLDLVNALTQAQNVSDAALFLQDLLTRREAQNLSKRLRIAKLLIAGKTYEEIKRDLYVSHGTIAKIAAWLAEKGDGFRKAVGKLPKKRAEKTPVDISDWDKFKRKHSLYFWPELLLEKVIETSSEKKKNQIRKVLDRLEKKNDLHRKIEKFLYSTV